MQPNILAVPYFSRLSDYYGLWMIDPIQAERLWLHAKSIDIFAHVANAALRPGPVQTPLELIPGKGKNQLAVVSLAGSLMKGQSSLGGTSTIAARRAVRQAAADSSVSGILLRIDSPGGTVAGTADLAADVKAANRIKPTWAHVEDTGASAAYWIASQAGQVFANTPTALVGSIGTVLQIEDSSAAAEKNGIKQLAFASGPLKAMGDGLGINDEQANYLQSLVNSLQREFSTAVQKGRGLTDNRLAAVSSGAVFPAVEAQRLGLIDGIKSLDKVISDLASA